MRDTAQAQFSNGRPFLLFLHMKAAAFEQCPGAIKSDLDPVVLVFVLQMALDLIKWVQVVGFEPCGMELSLNGSKSRRIR